MYEYLCIFLFVFLALPLFIFRMFLLMLLSWLCCGLCHFGENDSFFDFLDQDLIPYCYSSCSCWGDLFKKASKAP